MEFNHACVELSTQSDVCFIFAFADCPFSDLIMRCRCWSLAVSCWARLNYVTNIYTRNRMAGPFEPLVSWHARNPAKTNKRQQKQQQQQPKKSTIQAKIKLNEANSNPTIGSRERATHFCSNQGRIRTPTGAATRKADGYTKADFMKIAGINFGHKPMRFVLFLAMVEHFFLKFPL